MTTAQPLPANVRELYPWSGHYFAQPDGNKQHYLDEGSGKPVLMVHGNPTWSFYWRSLVKALSDEYRCIVPDHIGSGLSDKPSEWSYRLEDHIANLVRLIEHLDLRDLTVIVHDWGGPIGLGAAGRVADRVSRLVVCNTAVQFLGAAPLSIRMCQTPLGDVLIRGFNAFIKVGLIRATSDRKRMKGPIATGYMAPYPDWASRIGQLRFVQDIPFRNGHPTKVTMEGVYEGLDAFEQHPKLLIWGERDFVFTPAYRQAWMQRFPDTEEHALADASHWVVEDAADRVTHLVTDFLSRTQT